MVANQGHSQWTPATTALSGPTTAAQYGKTFGVAYALGGPMKDRLRRWLTPVVVDRIRRGTHDRADVT